MTVTTEIVATAIMERFNTWMTCLCSRYILLFSNSMYLPLSFWPRFVCPSLFSLIFLSNPPRLSPLYISLSVEDSHIVRLDCLASWEHRFTPICHSEWRVGRLVCLTGSTELWKNWVTQRKTREPKDKVRGQKSWRNDKIKMNSHRIELVRVTAVLS